MIGKAGMFDVKAMQVDYLIVAGGGGGGGLAITNVDLISPEDNLWWFDPETGAVYSGGAGGAGGVLSGTGTFGVGVSLSVSVGSGGQYWDAEVATPPPSGGNSSLGSLVAYGGGVGGRGRTSGAGGNGGNGGSGGAAGIGPGGAGVHGTGTPGQGSNASESGAGGISLYSEITGFPYYYGNPGNTGSTPVEGSGNGGRASTSVATDYLYISGAGTTAANGIYGWIAPALETFGGRRVWSKIADITWALFWRGANWNLLQRGGMGDIYTLTSTANPYPTGGSSYISGTPGEEPAPTVKRPISLIGATNGSSGAVILAYPDTLPALTVGAGLTYDQPSRSGYRVYRFTAGSGTITFN